MDASFESRAEQLAQEFAGQATTVEELNGLMRLMMKSGLERMLNSEMDVHLGRKSALTADESAGARASRQPTKRTVVTDVRRKPSKAIWAK
jgi:transposase-like protein